MYIYDWSELFLFSLFYSVKEDWTVCILVGSLTNWVCYPVDNEWTNSVLFESITILVFLVVTAAHSLSSWYVTEDVYYPHKYFQKLIILNWARQSKQPVKIFTLLIVSSANFSPPAAHALSILVNIKIAELQWSIINTNRKSITYFDNQRRGGYLRHTIMQFA